MSVDASLYFLMSTLLFFAGARMHERPREFGGRAFGYACMFLGLWLMFTGFHAIGIPAGVE